MLGDQQATDRLRPLIASLAKAADEGLCPDGSMIYERWTDSGETDRQRQWWVQCENIIGHTNLYQYYNDREALDIVFSCWQFVKEHLIDRQNGEWHWAIDDRGNINLDDDKAGFWKCPYHNTRMCLEILERTL